MRSELVLIVVAALALVTFDYEERPGVQLAQTGPLPTSVLNPGLGAAPPGGHLGETRGALGKVRPDVGAVPANPADRVGVMTGDHLGRPPLNPEPHPAPAAVPPPPGSAVPPPAAGAVPPATGLGR